MQRRAQTRILKGRLDSLIQGISQQPASSRAAGKAEDTINTWPSPVEGLTRRRPTRLRRRVSTGQLADLWADTILPQAGERYLFTASPAGANVSMEVTLDGIACAVDVHGPGLTVSGGTVTATPASYLHKASGLTANYRLVNSGAVALLLNRSVSVALANDLTPAIANEALVFVQSVAYDVGYTLTINGTALLEYRTPKATDTANTLSTAVVATALASRAAAVSGFTAQAYGPLVYITRANGAAFTVSLDDSRSNALARVLKDQVVSFSSLPAVARNGFTIKIASDPGSTVDDYWVRFATTDITATYGEGFWQEVAAPSIRYKFNENTMPLVVYRSAVGVLFIGPADGATRTITVGPSAYSYTFPLWGQRTAGDETTVPTPSINGRPIRDHFLHRGRYVVIGTNSVMQSKTDYIFTFFQDTSTTVLDTDPIDLAPPADGAATPLLDWGVAADESILVFAGATQFQIRAADGQVMTPKTTSIIRLSAIDTNTLLPPRLAGPNVVFSTSESGFTGFREYQFINTENRRLGLNLGGSLSITSEVPRLIPGLADLWDVNEGLDFMAVTTPADRSKLYIYKYLWSSSQGALAKQQSAWCVWQFNGSIRWVKFYDNRLWLIVAYSDGAFLLDMAVPELRSNTAPEYCLDRMIDYPECNSDTASTNNVTATYDAGSNRTTFVLPYAAAGETVAVVRFGNNRQKSLEIGKTSSGNTIVCSELGNWTGDLLSFGSRYMSRHGFGTAYPPARAEGRDRMARDQTGRLQLLAWTVFHTDSGPYSLRVARKNRAADTVKPFSPRQLNVQLNTLDTFSGSLDTGRHRTMVGTKNLDCTVSVESDSIFPFTLTAAAWEGVYSDRAQGVD